MTNGIPHPFEIFWDVDAASYYVFVPEGCLLVDGKVATNANVENENLALPFGDSPPPKVYCHLTETEDGEWEFTIDGNETAGSAKYDFLIATFGASENDGGSYDVVCSAMSFGGGTANADEVSVESSRTEPGESEGDEPVTVEELAIKDWHTAEPQTGANSVAGAMGLPMADDSSPYGTEVLTRTGKGGATGYRDIGTVDGSKLLSTIDVDASAAGTTVTITDLDGNETTFAIPPGVTPEDFTASASAETLEPTADATAEVTLADGEFVFAFGIPKGERGVGVGSVELKSTSGRSKTYSVKSDETPAQELGTFSVTDGADGADGEDGVDGVSVTDVTASEGDSTESDGYTVTPIAFTFTFSDGTTKDATANVRAKNGAAPSGTANYVSDVQYSTSNPGSGIQKKMATLNLATGTETVDQEWTTFAETSPHSDEHSGEGA